MKNDRHCGLPDEPAPDFAWPHDVAELFCDWLDALWEMLLEWFETALLERRFPRAVMQVLFWSGVAYAGLVWVCLCYVRFPVSPYGLWDMVKWVVIVVAVTLGGIYTVYSGGITMALFLSLLLAMFVHLTLSLSYLGWVFWTATLKRSLWLERYRFVLATGLVASVALATFVDGSNRFWDRHFEITPWIVLLLISASAWAALFCQLARNRAMEPATPRAVVKWTVGLAIGIGVAAFFGANTNKAEYFLRKNVVEHPNDASAWLDLAWHYYDEGDQLAADSGDENHAPLDPTPSYREALDCLNEAVSLGVGGFDVQFARAQLADQLGKRLEAVSFGREALNLAPSSPNASASEEGDVKWLGDMVARNAASAQNDNGETLEESIRHRRRDGLPGIVRWVFDLF
jgi:hypothetical protein